MAVDSEELRKSIFCGLTTAPVTPTVPDAGQFQTFRELVESTAQSMQGVANRELTADDYREAENIVLQRVQQDCFLSDLQHLITGKPLKRSSHLITLAPEFDSDSQLIRVGGRLRHTTTIEAEAIHPIVLDPKHKITQLLIRQYDTEVHHPGSE